MGPKRAAVLAGLTLGLAFLAVPLSWTAWLAFIPLLWGLERCLADARPVASAFRLGALFGIVFYLVSLHWITLLSDVAITIPWLKYPAWLVGATYLGLYPALASALAAWLARRSGRSLAVTFPIAFILIEEVRASGELGFPWFQPGYSQHAFTPLLQMASLGGVTLVTAWLLTVNVLLWRALLPARAQPGAPAPSRALAAAGVVLALALPWAWGARVLASAPRDPRPRVVGLVQGNIPGEIKWGGKHQAEILARFLELSMQAVRSPRRPALLIWPETATGSYLRRQLDQTLQVARLAAATRVPVFSGFPDVRFDSLATARYVNAAGMFRPDGSQSDVYAKRHLVPFGERMPFQRWFPGLGRIELGQAEWTPGERGVLYDSPLGRFSCLICFEAIFPDLAREDVLQGARWLVNITNDEWFGNSAALYQHAGMSLFRAVENHVPLARCANTGLTLVADGYGRVRARLPVLKTGVLVEELGPAGPTTLFTRVGDWPGVLTLLAGLALALQSRKGSPGSR